MRDYAKVSDLFWTGNTGRKIRGMGHEAQLAALYLITGPQANMYGVYHLPTVLLAHAIGCTPEGASKALQSLSEGDFCTYDEESEWVWVHEMARYQVAPTLEPKDNRVKHVQKWWVSLPNLPFLQGFFDRYADAFHLPDRKPLSSPFEAPPKPGTGTGTGTGAEEGTGAGAKTPAPSDESPDADGEGEPPFILLPLVDKTEYPIFQHQVEAWSESFPGIDVEIELRKLREWNVANAKNRKTKAGVLRHVTAWLSRAQDRSRPTGNQSADDAREIARRRIFGEDCIPGQARRVS